MSNYCTYTLKSDRQATETEEPGVCSAILPPSGIAGITAIKTTTTTLSVVECKKITRSKNILFVGKCQSDFWQHSLTGLIVDVKKIA